MIKTKFHRGQKLVCTHYKDKPVVTVTDIIVDGRDTEIWVKEGNGKQWWGLRSWFKSVTEKRNKNVR